MLGFPGSDLDGGTDHHHMPNGASEPVPCVDVCARAGEDIYTVFSDDFEAGVDEGTLPFSRPAPLFAWRENAGEHTAVSNDSAPSSAQAFGIDGVLAPFWNDLNPCTKGACAGL